MSMAELITLWAVLTDVPTDKDDCIEEPFLHFTIGEHREDIWHWFESQNPEFSVYTMQNGGYPA